MKMAVEVFLSLIKASCLCFTAVVSNPQSEELSSEYGASTSPESPEQQARLEVEQHRKQLEEEAQKTLDKDAIEVFKDAHSAVKAIEHSKPDKAVAAIRRAKNKIELLIKRNSAQAYIPVHVEVTIFDTAPQGLSSILEIAQDASRALDDKEFPSARVLLHSLMSEIRVRDYNLPLTTFPVALQEAARLLNEKKYSEARAVLLTALTTLVAFDRITPIPLLAARSAISRALALGQKDRVAALHYLQIAANEVDRGRYLGYSGNSPEYTALKDEIAKLEKQLKGNDDLSAGFGNLSDRITAFLKWQSERGRN